MNERAILVYLTEALEVAPKKAQRLLDITEDSDLERSRDFELLIQRLRVVQDDAPKLMKETQAIRDYLR